MYDYSNLKVEKVDDLPPPNRDPRKSKPLAPATIYETMPFLRDLRPGETIKITIPEDVFGYSTQEGSANSNNKGQYDSMRAALVRTFTIIGEKTNVKFVVRIVDGELYIKRLAF